MLEYRGKYNTANVFVDEIDETTVQQIYSFLNHPAFANTYIAVMPDCHAGKGAMIGFTMKMNDYIIPNIIGVDIGCAVDSYNLGKRKIDFEEFDKFIRKNIPHGKNVHNEKRHLVGKLHPLLIGSVKDICTKIAFDIDRTFNSIGSLGGGNHFIELDIDNKDQIWLTIHSGSRQFGLKVATYHQNKAKELMKKMFVGDAYKDLEYLPIDMGGYEYLEDMYIAQEYASINRKIMAWIILHGYFGEDMHMREPTISSIHNYIGDDNIIRKGAVSAQREEQVIIPFNMAEGCLIACGKGSKKYNYSAPHGAGRLYSRSKAKQSLSLDDFKETMDKAGVWSSCIKEKTLDEAPAAYKDKDMVLRNIEETIEPLFFIKPVYNFKSS